MALESNRPEGRYITARDVAERLMPDLSMNEVLLWPPDLFAYTSYIMTLTSAYQLVVSPPSGRKWPPSAADIREMMRDGAKDNLAHWFGEAGAEWGADEDFAGYYKKFQQAAVRLDGEVSWNDLVEELGKDWRAMLNKVSEGDFDLIDDTVLSIKEKRAQSLEDRHADKREREKKLFKFVLNNTPPLLLACWAFFYREGTRRDFYQESTLRISDLLCTQDYIQGKADYCGRLWRVSQAVLTMHAVADIASLQFGIMADPAEPADKFAEKLLFGRLKEHPSMHTGGSLSTFHTERCRVLPKRHNPNIGITLRSISSNLAFHQSAVDVVWRKAERNALRDRLIGPAPDNNSDPDRKKRRLSLLLLPFPLEVKTKDFGADDNDTITMAPKYGFFSYEPYREEAGWQEQAARERELKKVIGLIKTADKELPQDEDVDMIVFPESSLSLTQFNSLEKQLRDKANKFSPPSIIIAGVSESRNELADELNKRREVQFGRSLGSEEKLKNFNFPRNAVYCQYYDSTGAGGEGSYYNGATNSSEVMPKYKQYKHHRWQLDGSQIRRYGLSRVLNPNVTWWESIKIPKRRVSFLNVGDRMTISHLICEDLARQDPIAELVRHVGPTLVVTILMDGPQLKNRWSARYATVLSDDPGCSVITLTSLGMVKRHSTEFSLMSRVVALWNESGGQSREIELAQGAEAVLLTFWIDEQAEKTADGRQETVATAVLRLVDVIQIYPASED